MFQRFELRFGIRVVILCAGGMGPEDADVDKEFGSCSAGMSPRRRLWNDVASNATRGGELSKGYGGLVIRSTHLLVVCVKCRRACLGLFHPVAGRRL
jgi:hypothetical protein